MRKFVPVLAVVGSLLFAGKLWAEGPLTRGFFISKETFALVQRLAKEQTVVDDIKDQNRRPMDAGEAVQIQGEWVRSTDLSDLVETYRQKPSCQAMRDAFSKEISLVDCFTLDAQGRVVGSLYKPHDFLQDQNPRFVNCFNRGAGRVFINKSLPLGPVETVEISLPVTDGAKTVGVLVATVLPEKVMEEMKTMTLQAEGRYLTFSVAQQEYGVEIQKVREILEPSVLEPLAQVSSNVRWVMRLRNRLVPVVDLRRCFGLAPSGAFPHQCVVTVVTRGWDGPFLMGLLVDGIREVVQVWSKDLVGMAGEEGREQCLLGPVQCQDRSVLLLDVDALSEKEAAQGPQSNFGRMP